MIKTPFVYAGCVAVLTTACTSPKPMASAEGSGHAESSVRSFTKTRLTGVPPVSRVFVPLDAAMGKGDYRTAERIVRENIDGPFGAGLHRHRAELLARRGADAEALAEYMDLLHDRFGTHWVPSPRDLAPVLEIAQRLNRPEEADEIATRIARDRTWRFADMDGLNYAGAGDTPKQRLAHAYLVLAYLALGDMDKERHVRLCEQARALAPNDVPVLARLACAYFNRATKGDIEKGEALFRRAYALIPEGSPARRDLRVTASGYGLDAAGPNARTSLDDELFAYNMEGPAYEAARQARIARERREHEAEEERAFAALKARVGG